MEDEHEEASLSVPGGELSLYGSQGSLRAGAPFKLLAVDLDGTLLARDGVPHDVDRLAIARL